MRLSNPRTIKIEDIKKTSDTDKKIEAILDVINPFIENVTSALMNRLTPSENLSGLVKEVTLVHDTSLEVNGGKDPSYIQEVRIMNPGSQSITAWYWAKTGGTITVKASFAAGGSTSTTVTLFFGYK